ncbi:MAG: GPR endopeptidase [Clostridia bacterium]|nr:GPR endopeptidase [Clostridia bacterium]
MEIIKGVAERTAPDCIIVIDSLASRRAARINSTIQLSDAGISPGSGVGNRRADISSRTLGVPVIAIGVPLVVHASTIARDIISAIAKESGQGEDEKVIETLTQRAAEKHLDNMIVTPKNIDQIVQDMSGMIADAINKAIFGDELENLKDLLM